MLLFMIEEEILSKATQSIVSIGKGLMAWSALSFYSLWSDSLNLIAPLVGDKCFYDFALLSHPSNLFNGDLYF